MCCLLTINRYLAGIAVLARRKDDAFPAIASTRALHPESPRRTNLPSCKFTFVMKSRAVQPWHDNTRTVVHLDARRIAAKIAAKCDRLRPGNVVVELIERPGGSIVSDRRKIAADCNGARRPRPTCWSWLVFAGEPHWDPSVGAARRGRQPLLRAGHYVENRILRANANLNRACGRRSPRSAPPGLLRAQITGAQQGADL